MNEPRVYRQSPILYIFSIIVMAIFVFVMSPLSPFQWALTPFLISLVVGGLFVIFSIYAMSRAIIVSDTEIASQQFWITRSLGWSEIQQVSGRGSGLKLKNIDSDVTVTLDAQIPGYEEVIEKIGEKRPDLFVSFEFNVMERSLTATVLPVIIVLVVISFSGFIAFQGSDTWIPALFFVVIGIVVASTLLTAPQSVTLEGSTLVIKYLFKETAYRADEIESVNLSFQRTRNGRIYFAQLVLKNKKKVRISSLKPGTAVTYLVLKEWHKRQTAGKLSV
jgi:hypothetical protein